MSLRILVVMPVNSEHISELEKVSEGAEIVFKAAEEVDEELAKSADIIIGNIAPELIKGSERLRLLQLNSAGTDGYTAKGVLPKQTVLANATGAYGLAISEHMIGLLLCMMKRLDGYHTNMMNSEWKDLGPVTSIYGSNTLVVGMGDIGSEFAYRMHAMGSKVTAIRRNKAAAPDYVENIYSMDKLYECLEKADIVATCLPGTSETFKIFDSKAFSHFKSGAYFINIGRGNAVDTEALIEALNCGKLAGAALDVTEPEPLPKEHPLWRTPNIFITPHVSGGYHLQETHNRIIEIAARNIKHYINNEPFENVVDMNTGYRKNY